MSGGATYQISGLPDVLQTATTSALALVVNAPGAYFAGNVGGFFPDPSSVSDVFAAKESGPEVFEVGLVNNASLVPGHDRTE